MTLFSNLIVALVVDLQLHQPTSEESHNSGLEQEFRHNEMMEVPLTRNMEHRRLVLACYYLTSTFV